MEILDEDIEFVRKALTDASEAAKGWFETIVEQHRQALDTHETLATQLRELRTKWDELESERDDLKEQVDTIDDDHADEIKQRDDALETVRDWFHDTLYLGKPMTPPRRILRAVEIALGDA